MNEDATIQAGWYWHPQSNRPAYVFHGPHAWQVQFVGRVPEDIATLGHVGVVDTVTVPVTATLYPQLVPLVRRDTLAEERRRTPPYPLTLPCQICGRLTPSSFMPAPDGTWMARPRCDDHLTS